jgi:uncharacterized repeat protein (TIGR03803 family)
VIYNAGLWLAQPGNEIVNYTGSGQTFINAGTFLQTGGTGTTTINWNFNTTGTLDIQNGILSINSINFSSSSVLDIVIGGTSPGTGFSQLKLSGYVSLAGALNVTFANGFQPVIPDTFTFLTVSGGGIIQNLSNFFYPSNVVGMSLLNTFTSSTLVVTNNTTGLPVVSPLIVLHTFSAIPVGIAALGNADGATPLAGLILSGNTLYGTATEGGAHDEGTVFAVNTDGTGFSNLHSFAASSDGSIPEAGLILSGNTLYGTAYAGGTDSDGTVFAVNTNGTGFANLYNFTNGIDGANPRGGLILSGNTLYGTTYYGGSAGAGTVFAINTDGTGFTNLYSFTNGNDGAYPIGRLILSGNTLYGTASGGGNNAGTVFAINTDGTGFTNLYSFATLPDNDSNTNSDGAYPYGGLILSGKTLYGTAYLGGTNGFGTIFSIDTNGNFQILYTFAGPLDGDGAVPYGGLVLSGSTLYGTTASGGTNYSGTIFEINTNGSGYTILYNLSPNEGTAPEATLALSGSALYGTAASGGTNEEGTVFALSLSTSGPSPVQIVSPMVSGGNFNLSLQTVNGQSYTLYYNDDLATTNWLPYTNFSGNGGTLQLIVPVTNSAQRFFRIGEP